MSALFQEALNEWVREAEEEFRRELHRQYQHQQRHLTGGPQSPDALPQMVDVKSDALQAVGYDAHGQRLYIRFRGQSKAYTFYRVPVEVYGGLMNASSKGTYYNQHIKGRYSRP